MITIPIHMTHTAGTTARRSRAVNRVALLLVAAIACLAGLTAQTRQYAPPRTPWGDPDIQGTYTNKDENGTPMARPRDLAGKSLADYGPKEMAALNQQRLERARSGAGRIGGSAAEDTGAGPSHWYEHLDAQNSQPWLIFDPPEGTIPPAKPSAQKRQTRFSTGCRGSITNSYEDCSLYDRSITRGLPGSMTPAIYGNAYDITQGPGWVAIRYEMIHDFRIIPLDGRPHLPESMHQYMGDARGRWEGDTLVVETRNLSGKVGLGISGGGVPPSPDIRLVERFTRVSPDVIRYEVTVNDPLTYTAPWTAAFPLHRQPDYIMGEYACHEGNLGLRYALSSARADEAKGMGK